MATQDIFKIILVCAGFANGAVIMALSAYMAFDKVRRMIQERKRT